MLVLLVYLVLGGGGSGTKKTAPGTKEAISAIAVPVADVERRLRTKGDLWEPSIAADTHGNVVMMGLRIKDVHVGKRKKATRGVEEDAGDEQASEAAERRFRRTARLVVMRSANDGTTFGAPRPIGTPGSYDQRLESDRSGRLYAAWLDAKDNLLFGRSTNHGRTFPMRRIIGGKGIDKVELAVSPDGKHVFVATGIDRAGSRATLILVSHDGGRSFAAPVAVYHAATRSLSVTADLRFKPATGSVTSDLTVTPNGHVVLGLWRGRLTVANDHTGTDQCRRCRYIVVTGDHFGLHWKARVMKGATRDRYASIALAADARNRVYALYPTAVDHTDYPSYGLVLRVSNDGGRHFGRVQRVDAQEDLVQRRYPFLAARGNGHVFAGWVDNNAGENSWNVWGSFSKDAGARFTTPVKLSNARRSEGFGLFFGHYGELAWNDQAVHGVWSEGASYEGTTGEFNGQLYDSGSVFYSHVRVPS